MPRNRDATAFGIVEPQRSWPAGILVFTIATAVAVELTALAMSFLCDDAYIAFRYVHNAHSGNGLVWNPGLLPVEGYTSFAWVMMLWAAWSWLGIAPPEAAIPLSLFWHTAEFVVIAIAAMGLRRREFGWRAYAVPVLTLLAAASSRTFLQWMSGGLETALFNFAFVTWVLLCFRRNAGSTRWFLAWSATAALAALTRPDGLLLVLVTSIGALLRARQGFAPLLLRTLPLTAVLGHVLWRLSYYREWLPNTYYAKVGAPWPEAGARYLACYALESGLWVLPLVAVPWLWRWLARAHTKGLLGFEAMAIGTVLVHLTFYVVLIGGDHFEYRVLSHFAPLAVLAIAKGASDLSTRQWLALASIAMTMMASLFGWAHYALTLKMPMSGLRVIANDMPIPLRAIARWFDRNQAWLIFHRIGLRCGHHGAILDSFRAQFPKRMLIRGDRGELPARIAHSVGYVGWFMPEVAILDYYGLNDWVVARWREPPKMPTVGVQEFRDVLSAVDRDRDNWIDRDELRWVIRHGITGVSEDAMSSDAFLTDVVLLTQAYRRDDALDMEEAMSALAMLLAPRLMAHERHPPEGYFEAFAPNVDLADDHLIAGPRPIGWSLERAREIEAEWRQRVGNH